MEVVSRRAGALPAPLETLKLGKPLGKGGFAVVRSGSLKTSQGAAFPVAIKILHSEYSDESSQELRLFKEEAELMLQLDHRNIISAYGLLRLQPTFPGLEGHVQPAYALVLELMEGGSLAKLMVKQVLAGAVPKYTFSQALGWVIDVARALHYLHMGGKDGFPRIHRDVKLENVLLTAGMQTAKLADFGLQRAILAQHPEQRHAILLRRSMRPSITLPSRPGAGLSRLGPESERSSLRQASAAKLPQLHQQQQALVARERRSSASGLVAVQQDSCKEDSTSEPVFYAVDDNGLTPVALPSSPQPSQQLDPRPLDVGQREVAFGRDQSPQKAPGTLQSPAQQFERVRDTEIARRSRSMSQLDQVSRTRDTWSTPLASGASSARDGGVSVQGPGGGQLLRAGSDWTTNSANPSSAKATSPRNRNRNGALQVAVPSSPGRPCCPGSGCNVAAVTSPSPRSMLSGAAGYSPSAARPSPLGPAQSARRPNSVGEVASRFYAGSLADESQGSAMAVGSLAPRTPGASVPSMAIESVCAREAPCEVNDNCPPASSTTRQLPSATAAPSPPLYGSVSVPCPCSLTTACRVSPSGPTPASALGTLDVARPSTASVRDVLLESGRSLQLQPQDSRGLTPTPSVPNTVSHAVLQLRPSHLNVMRSVAATAPGGSPGMAEPVASGRLQVLTSGQSVDNTARQGGLGDVTSAIGNNYEVLRHAASANASSAVPRVAIDCSSKLEYMADSPFSPGVVLAPRPGTASGMIGPAGAERDRNSVSRLAGDGGRGSSHRISVVSPISCRAIGDTALMPMPAGGTASPSSSAQTLVQQQQSQPHLQLNMAELLHLRLGAQNISVRTVRSSASGALNRQMIGSAPSSPRLAAVAAATRSAAAAGGWQLETARTGAGQSSKTAALPSSASAGAAPRSGSMPTLAQPTAGAIKSAGPAADFEEVFSLTGRTGSLMYLAPEAYKNEPYNDKVDVYSLAILMYELFGRTSITYTHISTKLPAFSRMLCNADEFAERVAAGYRPPRTNAMAKMPPQLWELIESSWHQDPVQRPDIGTVLDELEGLVDPLAQAEGGQGQGHLARAGCGCTIS